MNYYFPNRFIYLFRFECWIWIWNLLIFS